MQILLAKLNHIFQTICKISFYHFQTLQDLKYIHYKNYINRQRNYYNVSMLLQIQHSSILYQNNRKIQYQFCTANLLSLFHYFHKKSHLCTNYFRLFHIKYYHTLKYIQLDHNQLNYLTIVYYLVVLLIFHPT